MLIRFTERVRSGAELCGGGVICIESLGLAALVFEAFDSRG